jgi:hypothetical protein
MGIDEKDLEEFNYKFSLITKKNGEVNAFKAYKSRHNNGLLKIKI